MSPFPGIDEVEGKGDGIALQWDLPSYGSIKGLDECPRFRRNRRWLSAATRAKGELEIPKTWLYHFFQAVLDLFRSVLSEFERLQAILGL